MTLPPARPSRHENGSVLVKVLLIGTALMIVAGVVVTAGLLYVGYRVKNAVERVAAGEPARQTARPAAARLDAPVHHPDVCSLLTREEAAEILGVAIQRVQATDAAAESRCQYFAPPTSKEAKAQAAGEAFMNVARKGDERQPAKDDNPTELLRRTGMGDFVKRVGALANEEGAPYMTVSVTWKDGRQGLAMMKATTGVLSGGLKTTDTITGLGDQAWMGPTDTFLMVVKGDLGISIDLSQVPQGHDKGIALARKVVSRL